jgi:prepilin-type processing-associated H-X9-DG protein
MKPQNGGAVAAKTAAAGGGVFVIILVIVGVMVVMGLCVIGVLAALLIPAVGAARDAAQRAQSMNNVKQIALGLLNYETTNNGFPPQYTVDESGQPLHSWRTQILPYLEQSMLYDQIDQTQPWDGGNNVVATDTELAIFRSPRYGDSGNLTNYVAVTGEGFLFNGNNRVRMSDVADGMSSTMFVIEIANSDIAWAEPRDLHLDEVFFEEAGAAENLPNLVRSGAVVGFVDGHVTAIQISDREELRKLLTINGGETVNSW